jgi:SAM-dependent methyltransferase
MNNNKNVGEVISNYFSINRQSFEEFYPSEKKTIEFVMSNLNAYEKTILDVGCASGGLYNALKEAYNINYTGIDIVDESIIVAKNKFPECDFICGDISNIQIQKQFDIVFSLSCIDWNLGKGLFEKLFEKLYSFVKDKGYLIISLRISCDDKLKNDDSFQYINFNGEKVGEKVQYGILGMTDLISVLNNSKYLSKVYVNGYEGNPSVTAVTKHKKLLFVVLALEKTTENKKIIKILDLPKKYQNIFDSFLIHL